MPVDDDRVTLVGFAYGVGLVWISTLMGGAALAEIPLTWRVGVVGILSAAVPWWVGRGWRLRGRSRPLNDARQGAVVNRDPWWWAAAAMLGVLCVITAARAIIKPIQGWDAWMAYTFKAKVMFLDGRISSDMFASVGAPNYPLGVSLQEVWVAWFMGTWDDVGIKWLFPGYLLALICLVYGTLRERMSPRMAIVGTLAASGLPLLLQHAQDGYTDLPFAYFALGNAVALTAYARRANRRDLILAAVMAAGLVWTREDGAALVACSAIVLAAHGVWRQGTTARSALRAVSLYVAPAVVVWGAWALVKLHLNIPSNLQIGASEAIPIVDRWVVVLGNLTGALFLDGNWGMLWALAALAALYRFRETFDTDMVFFVWAPAAYLGLIVLLFSSTELLHYFGQGTVLHRLILHIVPVMAIWVVTAFGRWWGVVATIRTGSVA
jgi:hypothetical protein